MSTNTEPRPVHGTTRYVYIMSSTGMLHHQGCPALTVLRSRITIVAEDMAATVTLRCERCHPMPHGLWITQGARPSASERADAVHADAVARRAAADAAFAASHTDACDAAIRAFCETDDQATYDAVQAALPHPDYRWTARARDLGLVLP